MKSPVPFLKPKSYYESPFVDYTPMHSKDLYWFIETAKIECLASDIIEAAQDFSVAKDESEPT